MKHKIKRARNHYAYTGQNHGLMKQLFNVDGFALNIVRPLRRAAKRQTILHLGQPNGIKDARLCGIPVTVYLPQAKLKVSTRLVPQWRFGHGMRTDTIQNLMRGKKSVSISERADERNSLVVQFH